MFSICPKDLVDKQALSPCKAHEKTFTTNKYMFVLCWEDMTIMKKYFSAHEDHSNNSLICKTDLLIDVHSLFIIGAHNICSYSEQ